MGEFGKHRFAVQVENHSRSKELHRRKVESGGEASVPNVPVSTAQRGDHDLRESGIVDDFVGAVGVVGSGQSHQPPEGAHHLVLVLAATFNRFRIQIDPLVANRMLYKDIF